MTHQQPVGRRGPVRLAPCAYLDLPFRTMLRAFAGSRLALVWLASAVGAMLIWRQHDPAPSLLWQLVPIVMLLVLCSAARPWWLNLLVVVFWWVINPITDPFRGQGLPPTWTEWLFVLVFPAQLVLTDWLVRWVRIQRQWRVPRLPQRQAAQAIGSATLPRTTRARWMAYRPEDVDGFRQELAAALGALEPGDWRGGLELLQRVWTVELPIGGPGYRIEPVEQLLWRAAETLRVWVAQQGRDGAAALVVAEFRQVLASGGPEWYPDGHATGKVPLGYATDQVQGFLRAVVEELAPAPPAADTATLATQVQRPASHLQAVAQRARGRRFGRALLGYEVLEVDRLLERAVAELAGRVGEPVQLG